MQHSQVSSHGEEYCDSNSRIKRTKCCWLTYSMVDIQSPDLFCCIKWQISSRLCSQSPSTPHRIRNIVHSIRTNGTAATALWSRCMHISHRSGMSMKFSYFITILTGRRVRSEQRQSKWRAYNSRRHTIDFCCCCVAISSSVSFCVLRLLWWQRARTLATHTHTHVRTNDSRHRTRSAVARACDGGIYMPCFAFRGWIDGCTVLVLERLECQHKCAFLCGCLHTSCYAEVAAVATIQPHSMHLYVCVRHVRGNMNTKATINAIKNYAMRYLDSAHSTTEN